MNSESHGKKLNVGLEIELGLILKGSVDLLLMNRGVKTLQIEKLTYLPTFPIL